MEAAPIVPAGVADTALGVRSPAARAVADEVRQHGVPARPGPASACSDREVRTFALGRELLGVGSERRLRRVLRADWR